MYKTSCNRGPTAFKTFDRKDSNCLPITIKTLSVDQDVILMCPEDRQYSVKHNSYIISIVGLKTTVYIFIRSLILLSNCRWTVTRLPKTNPARLTLTLVGYLYDKRFSLYLILPIGTQFLNNTAVGTEHALELHVGGSALVRFLFRRDFDLDFKQYSYIQAV